jgi:hypothetical protein
MPANFLGDAAQGETPVSDLSTEEKSCGHCSLERLDISASVKRAREGALRGFVPRTRPGEGGSRPNFIIQALRGRPITLFGTCTQTRSSDYVDDLERCFWGGADDDPGRLTVIGNDLEVSVLEVACHRRCRACCEGVRRTARRIKGEPAGRDLPPPPDAHD